MREHTLDLIRRYYAAFNAGDMATFLGLLAEEVVHDINQGGREVGKRAFENFMRRMNLNYTEQVSDLVVMASEDGNHAGAEFIITGTYLHTDAGLPPATGQRYRLAAGTFFEVAAGQIARVTTYYNLRAWLDQIAPKV